MLAPVTHIVPLTLIRRSRLLSESGRVLVRAGQKIASTDVVAEAPAHTRHLIFDLRSALELSGSTSLKGILQRKPGDLLQAGDIIAEKGGLFKRVVRAPAACQVISITGSRLLLEMLTPPVQLLAGFNGLVSEIIPERGVILETNGVLVQGVWGNGKTDTGGLRVLAQSPQDEIQRAQVDVTMRGATLFAAYCSQADVLQAAAELPVRGLILGSMPSALIPIAEKMPFPVLLIEGFGRVPLNAVAFKILSTNEKRDISIHALPWDRMKGERPEAIITLPADGSTSPESDDFKTGQQVRVLIGAHAGRVGTLETIAEESSVLPGGIRARCGLVRVELNQLISVPLKNLDVLE